MPVLTVYEVRGFFPHLDLYYTSIEPKVLPEGFQVKELHIGPNPTSEELAVLLNLLFSFIDEGVVLDEEFDEFDELLK